MGAHHTQPLQGCASAEDGQQWLCSPFPAVISISYPFPLPWRKTQSPAPWYDPGVEL